MNWFTSLALQFPWTRSRTIERLCQAESESTIPLLAKALTVVDRGPQSTAIENALCKFGPSSVPELAALVNHNEPSVRRRACSILLRIGGAGRETLESTLARGTEASAGMALGAVVDALDAGCVDLVLLGLTHPASNLQRLSKDCSSRTLDLSPHHNWKA